MKTYLRIKLVHSAAGRLPKHVETVRGLGLRRTGHERLIEDTPATRGMIAQVPYLVSILEEGVPASTRGARQEA